MSYTLQDLASQIRGDLVGNGNVVIRGVNTLEAATAGELAFAEHPRYVTQVRQTSASGIIVPLQFPAVPERNLLRVASPRLAFVGLMALFQPPSSAATGIHASAVVSPQAMVGKGVMIGEGAVVRAHARVGDRTMIESGAHVGSQVTLGEDCYLGPNVVLWDGVRLGNRVSVHSGTVIGDDGFGYVWDGTRHVKIPQLGTVVIEDDVEIGCNVCVDRAMLGATIIRRGTKIDNLVQIAHNNVIGEHVIMAGQVGLAGSVTVGNYAMLAGQAGVVDHITIGDRARVGAASPVTRDVKSGEAVWGFPARPLQRAKREVAGLAYLPRFLKELRELRLRVAELESRVGGG